MLERVGDFAQFLDQPFDEDSAYAALRLRKRSAGGLAIATGSEAWKNEPGALWHLRREDEGPQQVKKGLGKLSP